MELEHIANVVEDAEQSTNYKYFPENSEVEVKNYSIMDTMMNNVHIDNTVYSIDINRFENMFTKNGLERSNHQLTKVKNQLLEK